MIGVIADDTTGANDIGIMFSKNGYAVKILTYEVNMEVQNDCDVLIIDTDSRLDPRELSYSKVYGATKVLKQLGCSMYFNKTCSVFRGNIGIEFDAMLDCLKKEFAAIVLAYPKNGRKTVHGIHTVYGKKLEKSAFKNDPVHPMIESNLVSILSKQTDRKVTMIDIDIVRKGPDKLLKQIEKTRENYTYCIIDSETQEDLKIVAQALSGCECLCGSAAIAEELPKFMEPVESKNLLEDTNIGDENGILVVSGSLTPQTKAQIRYLIDKDVPVLVVDSRRIFSEKKSREYIGRLVEEATDILDSGKDLLIMADNREDVILETKKMGLEIGIDELKISKMVSAMLADITELVTEKIKLKRLVVAGGDTSGTICRKLGIKGNYVLKEIETGLPSGLAIGKEMIIVLKSGSFGKEDFLSKAIEHIKML